MDGAAVMKREPMALIIQREKVTARKKTQSNVISARERQIL